MREPKVQRLLRSAPIASRRTEGLAIVALCADRVIPPPRGPAESIFGGANRAGFSVSTVRRSIMLMRDTNFFQEAES